MQRFLNGDRDLERRRELAREHAAAAAAAAERALTGDKPLLERGRAMREVSRAVALDPQNTDAMETLVRLLTQPPRELPDEAKEEVETAARESQRRGSRTAGIAYLSWALYAPIGVLMGVRSWPTALFLDALWLAAAALSFHASRHPRGRTPFSIVVVSNLAIACSASLFGPFILAPALATANTLAFVVVADKTRRIPTVVMGCAAFLGPLLLEWLGLEPRSMVFRSGTIVLLPRLLSFDSPGASIAFLVVGNVALLATAAVFVARFKDMLVATEERLYMHTWHLRQLVPGDAHSTLASGAADPLEACVLEDRVLRRRHWGRVKEALAHKKKPGARA